MLINPPRRGPGSEVFRTAQTVAADFGILGDARDVLAPVFDGPDA